MKRALYIILLALFMTVLGGCDLLGSNEELTPPFPPVDTTDTDSDSVPLELRLISVHAEDRLMIPAPGRSLALEVNASAPTPNGIERILVRDEVGKVVLDTAFSEPRSRFNGKVQVPIEDLNARRLSVEVRGIEGRENTEVALPNVREKLVVFTARGLDTDRANIWHVGVEGGEPDKLFTYTREKLPADQVVFLPDGKYMAFDLQASDCNRIYTILYDGEVAKDWGEDCRFRGPIIDAELSPDGTKIAFVMGAPLTLQVFSWDLVSDEVVRLTEGDCTRFGIPDDMDSCIGSHNDIAYQPHTGDLYVSLRGRTRDPNAGIRGFASFSVLSKSGGSAGIIDTFPDDVIADLDDIHGNTAVFEARGQDGVPYKGLLFYDLKTGQWDIRNFNSWQFNFAPDGTGVAVFLGSGVGNQLIYLDEESQRVSNPVYVDDVVGIQNPHIITYQGK